MLASSFHYEPKCSHEPCGRTAIYKIAAVWSDGTFCELKTYALACELHRQAMLERAAEKHNRLPLADTERADPVGVFRLQPRTRGATLKRFAPDTP
jgi:hypothetical protein